MKLLLPVKNFLKAIVLLVPLSLSCTTENKSDYNVLFICIDDLNDWTDFLGGHPGAITPNMDNLANQSFIFEKAYCPAPACNPSRAAIMTGIRPSTSGVYINPQDWRENEVLKNVPTLPQYFKNNGYMVMGSGKTFHDRFPDPNSWGEYWPAKNKQRPDDPMPVGRPLNGIEKTHFDWGPVDVSKEQMGDWQVADWVISKLKQDYEKPFFLACGFYRPHLPWYVPQEYFDKFPLDQIQLPVVVEDDINDLPLTAKDFIRFKDHEAVITHNQWKNAVQGYLASINFVDECVGRVIDQLQKSKYRDNTIVVLWSDHGWHLGEKEHWRKFALWENTTRTVFLMQIPKNNKQGKSIGDPVSLLDIYPTLVDLCNLPENDKLEGNSLAPLFSATDYNWENPAITTHQRNNHTIRFGQWRYIQYNDGSEELYDHDKDPHEWHNLAENPKYDSIKNRMIKWIPEKNAKSMVQIKK